MLWRQGLLLLLVGVCLVLVRSEDEEVIKCTGGECVKLHLCPNGELNTDGANIIDIRFNPDNECEDYLLKCCPYPEGEEDDVVPPPPSIPGPSPVPVPVPGGPDSVPVTVPNPGPGGAGSVPPGQGTGQVPTTPSGPGNLGTGNKPAGAGGPAGGLGGGSTGGGYGKPHGQGQGHGHGHGQGHGGCRGDSSCSSSGSESDEQTVLAGADLIPGGLGGTSANQVKDREQVPQVQGGGPPVSDLGSGPTAGQPGTGKPQQGGTGTPVSGTGAGQQGTGGIGGAGTGVGSVPTQKPGGAGGAGPTGTGASGASTQKPGGAGGLGGGVGSAGGAPTPKPGQQGAGGAGAGGVGGSGTGSGGAPTPKPGQQGAGGAGSPGTGAGGVGGLGSGAGGAPTPKPGQQGAGGAGSPGTGAGGAPKPGQQIPGGTGGAGGSPAVGQPAPGGAGASSPAGTGQVQPGTQGGQPNVIGLTAPGKEATPTPGKQPGGAGQHHGGPGGAKHPGTGGGYNPGGGVKGTQPDKVGTGTQNPLDKTVSVPQKCGLRNVDGVGFRITGDNDGESEYGEFPWMVAILKEEKALDQVINVYQCGGSLIHPSVVLTAAHCVQNRKIEEVKVRLGEWDTQTKNEMFDYQDRNVVEIVSHAEFYKGGLFNDVALLFLDKPADLMETVNTICLPPANHNFDMSRCFASGWGKDVFGKQGTYQVILKKIELPIMPNEECQKALRTTRLGRRFKLHSSFICAGGEKGRDTCKGDGGSPLICPIPGSVNHYYQAGMVAWGIGCGEDGIPGVYVNVPMFRGWIDDHLRQHNITDSFYLYT
ncbi:collagen alpha-1(I) chain isoform X1 [Anopheles gambiae]|uniref:collagen alpha-1(I) chain isoform X1 n=1 Tax=Anopheles gambiae TaxID=7165 RepID=UPI002AC8D97F|nr:collagen alpha-1(I) chain isoform X1 [Anopheles gambiae]